MATTPTITGTITAGAPSSPPPPGYGDPFPLDNARRQQLDGIVQRMMANKESDENISTVVKDFKTKYSAGPAAPAAATRAAAPEATPPDAGAQMRARALAGATPEEAPGPLGFLKNVVTSTGNQIGNVAHAAAHPIDTVNALGNVAAGALNEYVPGYTTLKGELGETDPEMAAENAKVDGFKQNLIDRYGSLDKFGHAFYKDPAGVLMDLSMLFGGVSGAARGVGAVADMADAANVASKAARIADAAGTVAHGINPLTLTAKAAGAVATPLAATRAGGAVVNALAPVAAKVGNAAGKAVDAFDKVNDQSVGETARGVRDAAVNKIKIAPQLDPAEASAVRYGDEQGVQMPTSVRTGSKVAQNAENILQNLPFSSSVAKAARANEQATLAAAGAHEVEQLGGVEPGHAPGPVPTPLDAGEAIHAQLDKNIAEHHAAAGDSYDLLRSIESQPQFKANVQTGTRRVEAGIDEVGNPTYKNVPVMEDIQLPVPLRPVKLALKPIYDRMMRQMPVAQQQASAGLKALSNIVNGPDFESASITDENLGAIKQIARDTNSPVGQGLAKMAVKELDAAVRATVARAGPDATAALERGRASTIAKYAAQDVKDALPAEPAQLAAKLTAPGDKSINLLRSVAEQTPEHIPALAQSVVQGLIEKGTRDAGMDAPKGALSAWLKMGPETKSILFKGREQGITDWLTLNKKMAENPNPSGSGSLLMMGKAGLMTLHNPVTGIATLLGGKALARVLFEPTGARNLIVGMKLPVNSGKIGATVAADILKAAGTAAQPVRTTPNGPSTTGANGATIAGDGSNRAGTAGSGSALPGAAAAGATAGAEADRGGTGIPAEAGGVGRGANPADPQGSGGGGGGAAGAQRSGGPQGSGGAGLSDSRRVSNETLNDMAARLDAKGPKATVADALEGKAGGEVLQKLIADGVITPQEQASLVDAHTDELTKAGRERISQLMIGRFFRDPAQLDRMAPSIRGRIERIAAPLAQVEAKGDWNLTPDVQSAIDITDRARTLGIKSIADFLQQEGLFAKDKYSANAVTLAKALQTAKSTELTAAARQYAQDAAYAAKGTQTLMGDAPTPAESFAESFGKLKSGAQSDAAKFGETKKRTPPAQNTVDPDEKEVPSRGFSYDLKQPRFERLRDYKEGHQVAEDADAIYKEGKGGKPGTLWLNRSAAEVLRQILKDKPGFQGRFIEADDAARSIEQLRSLNPVSPEAKHSLNQLADQLRAATSPGERPVNAVVAVEGFGGRRIENVIRTSRHELAHHLQDELGGDKGVEGAIDWDRFGAHPLALPAAEKVAEKARAAGENVTSRDMLPEVPAYIAGGQWERVGLTLDGAVDVYDHYLKMIEEGHGTQGVDRALIRVHADIRSAIRERLLRSQRPLSTSSDGGSLGSGSRSGVGESQARGRRGSTESSDSGSLPRPDATALPRTGDNRRNPQVEPDIYPGDLLSELKGKPK